MKYITTNKHPELKEGIEFDYWDNDSTWRAKPSNFYTCTDEQFQHLIEKGYVKEVEGKEFTKSDMIAFQLWNNIMTKNGVINDLKIWLNQKNK